MNVLSNVNIFGLMVDIKIKIINEDEKVLIT